VEPEAQLQLPLLKMRGEGQFAVQEPDWQCSPEAHEWPQVPQLALLLSVLTHWPLQEVCPPEQPWHEPPTQVWPGPQETPQPPQLELVETSVHTPLQLFWPDGQGQHVDPQMYWSLPQQIPEPANPLQHALPLQPIVPTGQHEVPHWIGFGSEQPCGTHVCPEHVMPGPQAWLQEPQLNGSHWMSVQKPHPTGESQPLTPKSYWQNVSGEHVAWLVPPEWP
jgi:hypothetical protein